MASSVVLDFDRNPNISDVERLQSFKESVERAFNELEVTMDDLPLETHPMMQSMSKGDFRILFDDYGHFKVVTANAVEAKKGDFKDLYADYVKIDQANIDKAWVEDLMVRGDFLADEFTANVGNFTKYLTGVKIYGDIITAGTISTERLIIRDKDSDKGILYELNNIGDIVQSELSAAELKRLTLDGKIITAESIATTQLAAGAVKANNIDVLDLSAISADLGKITGGSLNIGNGNFVVTNEGNLTAKNGVFSGEINATSGTISFFDIDEKGLSAILNDGSVYTHVIRDNYFKMTVLDSSKAIAELYMDDSSSGRIVLAADGSVNVRTNDVFYITDKTNLTGNGAPYVAVTFDGGLRQFFNVYNGGIYTESGIETDGEIISNSANAFRAKYDNYGFFIRNDGSNIYFMLTDAGEDHWNELRPLIINCVTGNVSTGGDFDIGGITKVKARIQPNTSVGAVNLGYNDVANSRWANIYSKTSVNVSSDLRVKIDIKEIDDRYIQLFNLIQPYAYKFIDGTSGRTHTGFISQYVEEALHQVGLESTDLAFFCKDAMVEEIRDEEGNVIETKPLLDENGEQVYFYSLRYEEYIAIMTAKMKRMDAALQELKGKVN